MNATTSSEGQVSFDLADGRYKIRADYLGSRFWSDIYEVPTSLSGTSTISHQEIVIAVRSLFQGSAEPLPDVPVYLFTAAGSYVNLKSVTDADGYVTFNLPDQSFKVRADYRNQNFWSEDFNWQDSVVDIAMADAQVTVNGAGQVLPGVAVYAFSASGAYLNLNQTSDANGQVRFRLPAGSYKLRADYQGSRYWTDETQLTADLTNAIEISTGGGRFDLTVMKNANEPLAGVRCYVFSAEGAYLGMSDVTDADGRITFSLADGNYKYRVDHLGYKFWTDVYSVPDTLADHFAVPHQDILITVESLYQNRERLEGVRVYLFNASGGYMGLNQITDADGQVVFSLPDQPYVIRADYLGYRFWSDEFQSTDTLITIDHGLVHIYANRSGTGLSGAKVYLFNAAGAYLGWQEATDDLGETNILLPDRVYRFRVNADNDQVWSDVLEISPGEESTVSINFDE
jgi:hypothetical protein